MGGAGAMATVRTWYGGGDVAALTGKTWASSTPRSAITLRRCRCLPRRGVREGEVRAARASWARRCPHVGGRARGARPTSAATSSGSRRRCALRARRSRRTPHDWHARLVTGARRRCAVTPIGARAGSELEAHRGDGDDVPRTWRDRAEEALADDDFIDGDLARRAEARTRGSRSARSTRTRRGRWR